MPITARPGPVSPTTTVGSYTYDSQGRRKTKTVGGLTTVFVAVADNREVLEYNGATGSGAVQSGASGFDLDVSHRNSDSLRPFVAVSASTAIFTSGGLRLVPEGEIRYSHELFATAPSLVSIGGGNFAVNGITPSHNLLTIGGGIAATLSARLALFGDYHATLPTGNYWEQTVTAGARYKF